MLRLLLVLVLCLSTQLVEAATYYISPTGSDAANGTTTDTPWLTFARALTTGTPKATCGDTLILLNGVYGFGTSTGPVDIREKICNPGAVLTIKALNSRQARIHDGGNSFIPPILLFSNNVNGVAYITIDGIVASSMDNTAAFTGQDINQGCGKGSGILVKNGLGIQIKNVLIRNVNRYCNVHPLVLDTVNYTLVEDAELYNYHRHGLFLKGSNNVARRVYCNPRTGRIPDGYGNGSGIGRADSCVSLYPCDYCIVENVIADGTTARGYIAEVDALGAGTDDQILGSIGYKSLGPLYANARGVGANFMPRNTTIKDTVFYLQQDIYPAIKLQAIKNSVVDHVTIVGAPGTGVAFTAESIISIYPGDGIYSFTLSNIAVSNFTSHAFAVSGWYSNWTGNYLNAYQTAGYTPTPSAKWTNTSTVDPALGTCVAWIPAGSPLKGAGSGGSDIGATILYRYVNGVLTTIPLWDPITGAFPHGATDLDGTNAVAGNSLFDFHERININRNGCPFPAGYSYSTTPPTNPPSRSYSTDLGAPHVHFVDAGIASLTVAVMAVYDGAGAPAYATSVLNSCGSEDIPALTAPVLTGTGTGQRSLRVFGKINPTGGTCTITPTMSSSNWSGFVLIVAEEDDVSGYRTVASATGNSASPTVTAVRQDGDLLLSFLATNNTPVISTGPGQTLTTNYPHTTKMIRGASATKPGASDGVMNYVLAANELWALQAVALIPSSPGGPSPSTFRVTQYRIDRLEGVQGTPEVSLGPVSVTNQATGLHETAAFRLRVEILVESATSTSTGVKLYCRKNTFTPPTAGAYEAVANVFGSNSIRYFGPGVELTVPSTLTATTQRFTGSFASGWTVREDSLPIILPSMAAGTRTELDYQLELGNGFTENNSVECEIRRDDGTTLGVHTVLPRVYGITQQSTGAY